MGRPCSAVGGERECLLAHMHQSGCPRATLGAGAAVLLACRCEGASSGGSVSSRALLAPCDPSPTAAASNHHASPPSGRCPASSSRPGWVGIALPEASHAPAGPQSAAPLATQCLHQPCLPPPAAPFLQRIPAPSACPDPHGPPPAATSPAQS